MLPVSRELMLTELTGARKVLERWEQIVDPDQADTGFPVVDWPAAPEALTQCLAEMQAELVLVAGKCEGLAEAIHNRLRSG